EVIEGEQLHVEIGAEAGGIADDHRARRPSGWPRLMQRENGIDARMVDEAGADTPSIESRPQEHGRGVDRARTQDDEVSGDLLAVDDDARGAAPVDEDAIDERGSAHGEV